MSDAGKTPAATVVPATSDQNRPAMQSTAGGTPKTQGGVFRTEPGKEPQNVEQSGQAVGDPANVPAKPADGTVEQPKPGTEQKAPDGPQQDPLQPAPQPGSVEAIQAELLADPKVGKYVKEFSDTGALSEASIQAAATELGLPKALVEQYVANAKLSNANVEKVNQATEQALTQKATNVKALVGGDAAWTDFAAWANGNLSPEQLQSVQRAAEGIDTDPVTAKAVIGSFYNEFKAASGAMPRDVTREGAGGSAHNPDGYGSQQEMVAAMQDRRYNRDAKYTAEVEAKVKASNWN